MTQIKKRAVSVEQKEKRRQDILDSARELFESSSDYNSLQMKKIAENIGLTKGTLYLYFKTKEEVFLALYTDEFLACFDDLYNRFKEFEGQGSVETTCEILSKVLLDSQIFLRLNAMLHSVLEQNIEFETALQFKTLLRDYLIKTGSVLESHLDSLLPGQGAEFLLNVHALMIGYYHAAAPTPALENILSLEELSFMRLDFAPAFSNALEKHLFAICEQNKRQGTL